MPNPISETMNALQSVNIREFPNIHPAANPMTAPPNAPGHVAFEPAIALMANTMTLMKNIIIAKNTKKRFEVVFILLESSKFAPKD